jgi:hypothetical protein
LWGSITRDDFDPNTSDIDIICIVNDDFPEEMNQQLREELTQSAPEKEWGFQIIYLDELNGGRLRSRLARAMSPQSILPSFGHWFFVCGKKFTRESFTVRDASIPERMLLNIEEIRKRLAAVPADDDCRKIRDRKGIVKAVLLLIYNRQQLRYGSFELNYNTLPDKADDTELAVLHSLLKIKREKTYDESSLSAAITTIENLISKVEQELS